MPLSLILLDVDYFKNFNDCYGHLAGDECLRKIGLLLTSIIGRATDIVARYGGEEFVAILTDTNQEGAATLAERIRIAVETLDIPHSESEIADCVTVSLGVATVNTTHLQSEDQVVALADEAMYNAKKAGRNKISLLSEKDLLNPSL
jgi:diguanylate cyclase (GGDEF)-like protein